MRISDWSSDVCSSDLKPLVYFDSANTGQKPVAVIEAVDGFHRHHNANVSRAVHTLGGEATELYEDARRKLARFTNVRADELVLCSGTTFARSEEHTSALQSLMRISYAVFCLKKKHKRKLEH